MGEDEQTSRSVNVRNRDDVGTKTRSEIVPLDRVIEQFVKLKETRKLENRFSD